MFDLAFTAHTLRQEVRRVDFLNFPSIRQSAALDAEVQKALAFVQAPTAGLSRLKSHTAGSTTIRRLDEYWLVLAVRKLNSNICHSRNARAHSRDAITRTLLSVLAEAVPYRIYKLDVRKFFESVSASLVVASLRQVGLNESATERLVLAILEEHKRLGGQGLPRGLAISSTIAELVMASFDACVEDHPEVFFYRRYVDDLTIVASAEEDAAAFVSHLAQNLPTGLEFKSRKQEIYEAQPLDKPKAHLTAVRRSVEYLGYQFTFDAFNHHALPTGHRGVLVDVAPKKIAKIKTRVLMAMLDFTKNRDFQLLDDRLRHLTSNLSLLDRASGMRRLVGIHFNYPLVDAANSALLRELDQFLVNALHSRKGRIFRRFYALLTPVQRVALARHSFVTGATRRKFFQMGLRRLGKVQRCWKYA